MKLQLDVNLKTSKNFFHKGVYDGELHPELIAEMKAGSNFISEIKAPTPAPAKKAPAKKSPAKKTSK